jgi:hypothetical protein
MVILQGNGAPSPCYCYAALGFTSLQDLTVVGIINQLVIW